MDGAKLPSSATKSIPATMRGYCEASVADLKEEPMILGI